jgi:uncharacterized paraquat-inducible protein A
MENLVTYSILYSPLIATIVAVVIYLIFGLFSDGKHPSLFLFVLGNLGAGIVVSTIVVKQYCTWFPGNLCGMDSVFFGLLAFSLTVVAYSCIWARHYSNSTEVLKVVQSSHIPTPEHHIKCSQCGAVIAEADTICVWCGYNTEHHL